MKIKAPANYNVSYLGVKFNDGIAEVDYIDEAQRKWFLNHLFTIEEQNDIRKFDGKRDVNESRKSKPVDRQLDGDDVHGDGSTSSV